MWRIPEAEIGALPDVDGLDTIELGCGTAYFSAWLARRGARPVGVDQSKGQLATARTMQAEHGIEFPLIEADAEAVPLPDASFDFALSEYGASLWCEPERWIAEAARLLRPGAPLVFLTSTPLLALCSAPEAEIATERLARPQFGLHRVEWHDADGPSVEFHLPHGEMIRVLREAGFEIEALHELQPAADARTTYGVTRVGAAVAVGGDLGGAEALGAGHRAAAVVPSARCTMPVSVRPVRTPRTTRYAAPA